LPFGEELFGGGRTTTLGYSQSGGVRQKFTGYERDGETDLEYAQARYYSHTQGRFASVDPENLGANPPDPQSWNGYAYARSNPVLYTDPDGRDYLVCNPDRTQCGLVSDDKFYKDRSNLEGIGLNFTGSRDFFEHGQISDPDGNVLATYVQISIDDPFREFIYQMRIQTAPIPKAVTLFFGISAVTGATGGVVFYALSPATITTLGLSGAPPAADSIPDYARRVLNYIQSSNGSPPQGYKGGQKFLNDGRGGGQVLPKVDGNGKAITYREYDVNTYQKGVNRGTERIVRGSDGSAYYTDTHYRKFTQIR
jgi:RHS repeat-associated protein